MRNRMQKAIWLASLCVGLAGCSTLMSQSTAEFFAAAPSGEEASAKVAQNGEVKTVTTACHFTPTDAAVAEEERGKKRLSQPARTWLWWGFGR